MKYIAIAALFWFSTASAQEISCNNAEVKDAFTLALETVDINVRRGILAAGAEYGGEWTRDIAINSWNGVSVLRPRVAERSLWSVTIMRDTIGHQYWDKILWAIAAYHHYLVTGDREFLSQAYRCSANTMNELEKTTFDEASGLFMGPSVFNDGIAGYPEPIYEPGNYSSSVLDFKNSSRIKCLSTNCVYYGAYSALCEMSNILQEKDRVVAEYREKAESLKQNILKHFYDPDENRCNYLLDQNGKADSSQEALGLSFAVIFGIVDREQADALMRHAHVSKFGVTSIYPDFPRYSASKPGRHNNIIWPMVEGFFARAARIAGVDSAFTREFFSLTHLALDPDKGDYDFREVYNPYTGKPDGGYQDWGADKRDFHWESCRLQTWSATAYLSMVLNGIMGFRFDQHSISFEPFMPAGIDSIALRGISYRKATLNIAIRGEGKIIKKFSVDGRARNEHSIDARIEGSHDIVIDVESAK